MADRAASLHLRILGYLLVPPALMAAVLMFEVYASANRSTGQIQDQMLLSYALGISEHAVSTGGDLVYIDLIQQTTSGTVFYWVEGPDNAFVSGYSGLRNVTDPTALNDREPRFFDSRHRGRDVRVVALRSLVEGRDLEGWMTVYVAQPTAERRQLVWSQIANSALRLSLLILVAGVLGWVAVSRGLKPLARLERAIGVETVARFYAMAETALRHRLSEGPDAHRQRVAALWAGASEVAAGNPHAWARQALTADEIAEYADFFSFGTNDLTQMTFGYSRDDVNSFLPDYLKQEILECDPFQSLDTSGVGQLVQMGVTKGRKIRKDLKVGICGEHGGDPASITFCNKVGLDYVSCSPFRVPIARLAAAQAALVNKKKKK